MAALTAIYGWHVQHGTGTFEIEVPSQAEMARRHLDLSAQGLPWLVAQGGDRVLGFAHAAPFRPRAAFRHCVEDSVYLAPDCCGQGTGRLLLAELMGRCAARGATQMLAVIGDAANAASIGLHRAAGFEPTGVLRSVGYKFDRWLDVVLMQRPLTPGNPSTAR